MTATIEMTEFTNDEPASDASLAELHEGTK